MAQLRLTSKGAFLLVLVLTLVAFGIGFSIWQFAGPKTYNPTGSSAGADGCGGATTSKDCGKTCSPAKGANNTSFACKWVNGGCKESAQTCAGSSDSGSACNGIRPNTATEFACTLGSAPTCQKDSNGSNTGYVCNCIDMSPNGTTCKSQHNCATRDTSKCPSNYVPRVAGSCGTLSGNCVTFDTAKTLNVYTCPNMTQADGAANGCQQNGKRVTTARFCPDVAKSFCGWIQIDEVGTSFAADNACFNSWFLPCDTTKPPVNPPEEPPVETNVCDGGSVTSPAASSDFNVGDTVTLRGYAFDKDGINKAKIVVKVDGAVAGNATATDHTCASATADSICTAAAGKPAVDWTYTYTVSVAGAHTFAVSWEDTKGLGGANCQGSRSITANTQGNPEWEITKKGTSVCLDETAGNQRARVSYTITVKNVGNLAGQLTNLVDTQDSKMKESYITDSSITPSATVSGKVITWDLDGTAGQFDPNETKSFKYSAVVPETAFGTYTNTVVATPDSGDTFQAVEITVASCNPAEEIPETALFDSVVSKVALGIILIGMSAAYMYSDSSSFTLFGKKKSRKEQFEERVAGE